MSFDIYTPFGPVNLDFHLEILSSTGFQDSDVDTSLFYLPVLYQ